MSLVHCKCPQWKYKEIKTTCACGGIAYYQKIDKITEKNPKQVILEKLKKELKEKRTDITILKMEIQELKNEIKAEESTGTSTEDGEKSRECVLSNGAIVERVSLPNCDCSSCN